MELMAAAKKQRIQSLESLFPIIPTDLRELVSSWLPPAREPSPEVDECAANIELNGRQERYHNRHVNCTLTNKDWHWGLRSHRPSSRRNSRIE